MNTVSKTVSVIVALTSAIAASFVGSESAYAAGGIRAAYVENVIPSKTTFDRVSLTNTQTVFGPGSGVWGISTITITNFSTQTQSVFIFRAFVNGATCTAPAGGASPSMYLLVPAGTTAHYSYPVPLTIDPPGNGVTCLGATTSSSGVELYVTGVVN